MSAHVKPRPRMLSRRGWLMLVAGISMLPLAGVVLLGSDRSHANADPVASIPAAPLASPVVRAQQITAAAAHSERTYTGVVRARYESNLAFRVGGKIISRHVEVGQTVTTGSLLFKLDPTDYELAVKVAEADLAAGEADVAETTADESRVTSLHRHKALTLADLDKSRSLRDMAIGRRDRAKGSLQLARNRLAYCELRADCDGVIVSLAAETGQVVADGQPVARLARTGEREAVVDLPENQVSAATASQATITLWSEPGEPLGATLRELSPIADPGTRTYQARFTIRDAGPKVFLGMTATVHLAPRQGTRGYAVPLSSLVRDGGQPAVWIADRKSGALTLSPVAVQEYRHEEVVLTEGVKPGQWVVTAGVQKLDANLKVRFWEGTP